MSGSILVVAERTDADKAKWSYARFTATFEAIHANDLLPIGKPVYSTVLATASRIVAVNGWASRIVEPERVDAPVQARVWLDLSHLLRLIVKVNLPEIFWFDPLRCKLWWNFPANELTFDRKELMDAIRFEFNSLQFWKASSAMCPILQIGVSGPLEIDTALQV